MGEYITAIAPYFAEILVDDKTPERVSELRYGALKELRGQLNYYQNLGISEKILYSIAEKKGARIMKKTTKTEMEKLMKPHCPHFDGNNFIDDEDIIPEEEMICWSQASLVAPLNEYGFKRYMHLFQQIFPQEYEEMFGKLQNPDGIRRIAQ